MLNDQVVNVATPDAAKQSVVKETYARRRRNNSGTGDMMNKDASDEQTRVEPKELPVQPSEQKKGKRQGGKKADRKLSEALLQKQLDELRTHRAERLRMESEEALREIDELEAKANAEGGHVIFPGDDDEINWMSTLIRLTNEELSQDVEYSEIQKAIMRHLGERIKKKPMKHMSPFPITEEQVKVPLEKALALRRKLRDNNEIPENALLMQFGLFVSCNRQDINESFQDDQCCEYGFLNFLVHCLRHDEIIHKFDCVGYRIFLTPQIWSTIDETEKMYNDDKFETTEYTREWINIKHEIGDYDINKVELIFIPIFDRGHYLYLCINFIHDRVDILDSNDYLMLNTGPMERHKPIINKIPVLDTAFHIATNWRVKQFATWSHPLVDVPKQVGSHDCIFNVWKFMMYYDGNKVTTSINPYKSPIFRSELLYYLFFHLLN